MDVNMFAGGFKTSTSRGLAHFWTMEFIGDRVLL
jgi:hypothetical protein